MDDGCVERCDPLRICLVSDFFCPNTGGVETHIYFLADCLLKLGHKVIIITHAYGQRKGVRYLSNGLKVYYLPFVVAYNGCSLASITGSLYWFRKIFIRERIQLVHGHSTFSSMAHESMFHGWSMGLSTVFTDHSLFGFADASAILTNNLVLHYSLANVGRVICVSYTSKENTVLRGGLAASKVAVIPNAINTDLFIPNANLFYSNQTTIIVLSRLVYRKGADLLTKIIPEVCARHRRVRFIVGGEGPKRVDVEEMRERYCLQDRVVMLGTLPHNQVRDVLVQGQIFLNTSLTEAFCMSIVEAASCGLHVVSTHVGGIPEVLPDEFIITADPVPEKLVNALMRAIQLREQGHLIPPDQKHAMVKNMYAWSEVAKRTERVYAAAMRERPPSWWAGIKNYYNCGIGFGILYIWVALTNMMCLLLLDLLQPSKNMIDHDDMLKIKRKSKHLSLKSSSNEADEKGDRVIRKKRTD